MKKLLSIIIALATLLLVSCAGDAPAENTEPSWLTSIISTTASAQEATTAATGTVATAGTNSTTAAPTPTTATSSTSGGAVPAESFKPSGYTISSANTLETRSKVIIADYGGSTNRTLRAVYYYSKADGEFYPFCFDPFCDHSSKRGTIECIGHTMMVERYKNNIYYFNSRIYFVLDGTIYSCSELATDLRKEIVIEDLSYLSEEEYNKRINQNHGMVIHELKGDSGSLFFEYVNPEGKVVWYRYDTKTRKLIDLTEKIESAEKRTGLVLFVNDIAGGHIFMYGGITENNMSWNYVSDFEFTEIRAYDEYGALETLFQTSDGLVMKAYYKDEIVDSSPDIDYVERSSYMPNEKNYDIVLLKTDGTTELLVENARKTFGYNNPVPLYLNDKSIYFADNSYEKIGVEFLSSRVKTQDVMASFDGKIYRYNIKTGEVDVFFESDTGYCDIRNIEYINENEGVAILKSQYYTDKNNIIDGFKEYEVDMFLLKCHLNSNGIVDSFEIMDME